MFPRANRFFHSRPVALIALAGGVAGSTLAVLDPAEATSLVTPVINLVTCSKTTSCVAGTNTGSGTGVAGTSSSGNGTTGTSTTGIGVYGSSSNENGVFGISTSSNGVYGYSTSGFGVKGMSPSSDGVVGASNNATGVVATSTNGYGVMAVSTNADGVVGAATSGDGLYGSTTTGAGVFGIATGSGTGTSGESTGSGAGVYASSSSGDALQAASANGIGVRSDVTGGGFSVVGTSSTLVGNGGDFEGGRFGIVGRAQTTGYPLVLTDSSYNNVFTVSGVGNTVTTGNETVYGTISYHGGLTPFVRTATGTTVAGFTAKSTAPTIEDTGTAQLTAGLATVTLEPTFASTIDKSTPYRVFLTPDGDTRGLFVAEKTPRGFVVRETQGGRSSLSFDYRIVAASDGQATRRMAVIRDVTVSPKTPVVPLASNLQPSRPSAPIIPKVLAVKR